MTQARAYLFQAQEISVVNPSLDNKANKDRCLRDGGLEQLVLKVLSLEDNRLLT